MCLAGFLPAKRINTKIIRIIFFPNVCQFVRCIASPKQPQSETGFVTASTRVKRSEDAHKYQYSP